MTRLPPRSTRHTLSLHDALPIYYDIQQRTLVSVESTQTTLFGGSHFALNDVTLFKSDSSAMITINAHVNGELLNAYWADGRSEEHTSELQSLMRISYAVFCWNKKRTSRRL